MGVGTWKVNNPPLKGGSAETIHAYVIAWLAVQNKQGEDKGLPIIWPSALCLSYFPGTPSAHARATLKCIPELPSQLQASPPAPASFVPFSEPSANHDVQEDDSPMSTTSTSGPFSSQKIGTPVESNHLFSPFRRRQGTNYPKRPAFLSRSPTSDSLMALKTLTLSGASESIQSIAPEVSGFVEAVARERELQRERIKRERENVAKSNSSSLAKHSSVTLQPPKVRDGVQSVPTIPVPGPSVRPVVQGLPTPSAKAEQDTIFPPPGIPDIPEATPSTILPEPEVSETPVKMETSPVNTPAPSMPLPIPDPMSTSFEDAFGGFDTPWPQNGNGFMNLSYDMDFNMNLDTIGGDTGNAGNPSTDFDIDDGFGVFTDDDFNVFDDPAESKPQVAATVSVGRNVSIPSGLVSSSGPPLGLSPPNLGDTLHISGPGPPSAGLSQPSTWGTHQLGDIFTPHPDSIPPELLPPSPGKTPSSYSAPATPLASLQFSETPDPIISSRRKSFQSGLGPNDFGPIPFAASHRIADGKYAIGKFSLPSPPDEEDRTEAYGRPWLSASYPDVKGSDWQDRYKLVTDPRVGVVRKLVGVKRRREVQGGRPLDASPRWSREYEEWEDTSVQAEEPKSESDDDEDDTWVDEEDSVPNAPRPVTPPPSYLPLGPTLLQTYFQHRHLLPLSMPLRLPGSVVNNSSNLPAPISVPTPVSPAAILGAASEKTKSLEAAAQILVREIVENRVWADAWRVNSTAASVSTKPPAEVRQFDAMSVLSLLRKLPTEHGTLDLKTLYGGACSELLRFQSLK